MKVMVGIFLVILISLGSSEAAIMRIGQNMTVTDLPLEIAKEERLFEKYGLVVETMEQRTTGQLLAAGEVRGTVAANASRIIAMNAKGVPARIVACLICRQMTVFIVRGSFDEKRLGQELHGASIGLISVTGGASAAAYRRVVEIFRDRGVDVGSFQPVEMSSPPMISALSQGRLNGAIVNVAFLPKILRETKGNRFKVLIDLSNEPYPFLVVSFRKDYLDRDPLAVESFLKAMAEAIWVMRSKKETALRLLASRFALSEAEVREEVYKIISGSTSPPWDMRPRYLEEAVEVGDEVQTVSVADTTPLERLARSGFFDQFRR